jgi:TRAP-type C4-dicarboxylate transport system permease small subunit
MLDAILSGYAKVVAVLRIVIAVLLALSVALNLANVVGRYALHAPIEGAEEVMLFFMVGIVFIGASIVSWEGGHIRMDIVVSLMPAPIQRALGIISDLSMVAVCAIVIWLGFPVIHQLAMFHERSQAANVPLAIPESLIPIGLGLVIVSTILRRFDVKHAYAPVGGFVEEMLPTSNDAR